MPAHITLKYPFPNMDAAEIERTVRDFCRSQTVTQWKLRDFGHFINPGQNVIFIDAVPSEGTRQVHAALLDQLGAIPWVNQGLYDGANIHYHITLVIQGITPLNFEAVWAFVNQQEKPNFEVDFDHIALVAIDGDWFEITDIYRFQD